MPRCAKARFIPAAAGIVLLMAGCAPAPRQADFEPVERAIEQRIGQRIHWYTGTEADEQARQAVQDLLAQELTADQAVQIALLTHPGLQATYEELGIAQADLVQAGLLRNPVFDAEFKFDGGTNIELGVTQDFLSLLQLPMRRRIARTRLEAAELRVADAILAHAADTRTAYYNLQAARQNVELFETVAYAMALSLEAAQRLHDAGNITDLDLARELALHEQAQLDLARARARAAEHREHLNALMGLWDEHDQWQIHHRLPDVPEEEFDPRNLQQAALDQRLDLQAAEREAMAAAQALGLERRYVLLADLELGVVAERHPDGDWGIGPSVAVPIPLFDTGQARLTRGQARLRQAERRYHALAVEVRADVRRLHGRLTALRQQAIHYRQSVLPLHARIVDEAQLQFNAMQIGIFQLLQAKRDQIDAGGRYIDTLRDYWTMRAELERVVGGRLSVEMPAEAPPLPHEVDLEADPPAVEDHEHH